MKGYFIISVCCVLFVASQGYSHNTKHSTDGPVYDGLNTIIADAKDHAQLVADDLTQRINETFIAIKEKVDQLKDTNTFAEEIEALKARDDLEKCLKEHELAIAQFMRKVVNAYEACSKDVKQEISDVVGKFKDILKTIHNAPKKIDAIGKQCVSKNENDTAATVLCVVSQIPQVQEEVFEANQSLEKFIDNGVAGVETLLSNKCDEKDLRKEFDSLLAKIESCVEKSKQ